MFRTVYSIYLSSGDCWILTGSGAYYSEEQDSDVEISLVKPKGMNTESWNNECCTGS